MEGRDVARVLAAAAAFDNRKVDDLAVIAWGKALDEHLNARDALEAVAGHYAETTDWLMPAHVNARVKAMRARRTASVLVPAPPSAIAPDDVAAGIAFQRAYLRAIGDGRSEAEADVVACSSLGVRRDVEQLEARPMAALLAGADPGRPS